MSTSQRFAVFSDNGTRGTLLRISLEKDGWKQQVRRAVLSSDQSTHVVFVVLPDLSTHPLDSLKQLPRASVVQLRVMPAGKTPPELDGAVLDDPDEGKQEKPEPKPRSGGAGGSKTEKKTTDGVVDPYARPSGALFKPGYFDMRKFLQAEKRQTLVRSRKVDAAVPAHMRLRGELKMSAKALVKFRFTTLKDHAAVDKKTMEMFQKNIGKHLPGVTLLHIHVHAECVQVVLKDSGHPPKSAFLWLRERKKGALVDFASFSVGRRTFYIAPRMVEVNQAGRKKVTTYFKRLIVALYQAKDTGVAVEQKDDGGDDSGGDDSGGVSIQPIVDPLPVRPVQLRKPVVYLRPVLGAGMQTRDFHLHVGLRRAMQFTYMLPAPKAMAGRSTAVWRGQVDRQGRIYSVSTRTTDGEGSVEGTRNDQDMRSLCPTDRTQCEARTLSLLSQQESRSTALRRRFRDAPGSSEWRWRPFTRGLHGQRCYDSLFWEAAASSRQKAPLGGTFGPADSVVLSFLAQSRAPLVFRWLRAALEHMAGQVGQLTGRELSEFTGYWSTRMTQAVCARAARLRRAGVRAPVRLALRCVDPDRLASMQLVRGGGARVHFRMYLECGVLESGAIGSGGNNKPVGETGQTGLSRREFARHNREIDVQLDGDLDAVVKHARDCMQDVVGQGTNVRSGHAFLHTRLPQRLTDATEMDGEAGIEERAVQEEGEVCWERVVEWGGVLYE